MIIKVHYKGEQGATISHLLESQSSALPIKLYSPFEKSPSVTTIGRDCHNNLHFLSK